MCDYTEVALSLLLLIGGLMIRTFISFLRVNPGFRTDNLLTMKLALPFKKYPKPQQQLAFYEQVIEGQSFYVPFSQRPRATMTLIAQTAAEPEHTSRRGG